jgi:hypothetical protein
MTDAQRIAALEESVTRLEAAVGMQYAVRAPTEADLKPESELPSGRYPLLLSDFEIRQRGLPPLERDVLAINELLVVHDDRLDVIEATDPGNQPPPSAVELVDGLIWQKSTNGIGIAFESDTNFLNGQRPPGTKYRQVFCVVLSDDGGGGIHQNIIYPEDGGRAYIPDPTRFAVSYRLDRQGMMSLNIHRAGAEFAPGKFAVTAVHKGQLAVVIPEESGSVTLRLPQGGDLLVEKGNGNADRENGHKATISRQPVVLGDDVGSPAIGGLPGGGGT